jgi:hypothetical protein
LCPASLFQSKTVTKFKLYQRCSNQGPAGPCSHSSPAQAHLHGCTTTGRCPAQLIVEKEKKKKRKRILGNGNGNGNESLSEGSVYLELEMEMKMKMEMKMEVEVKMPYKCK